MTIREARLLRMTLRAVEAVDVSLDHATCIRECSVAAGLLCSMHVVVVVPGCWWRLRAAINLPGEKPLPLPYRGAHERLALDSE